MTGVNKVACSGVSWLWCVFFCVRCSMMTAIFIGMYNSCVMRLLLLCVKGT